VVGRREHLFLSSAYKSLSEWQTLIRRLEQFHVWDNTGRRDDEVDEVPQSAGRPCMQPLVPLVSWFFRSTTLTKRSRTAVAD
jgi:hypothetical protein